MSPLIIILFFGCVFSQDFIQEPNVIQLGEYTNLICSLNYTNYLDLYRQYFFSWYDIDHWFNFIVSIQNNEIYNNRDPKKYNTFMIDDKFILQITNMTEDDKKYKFECIYLNNKDIQLYKYIFKNLTFFNPLSSENMKIEYVVKKMKLKKINIKFKKIFPIPKCFIKINDYNGCSEDLIRKKSINYIYSKVNLRINIIKTSCNNKIEIICDIMNKNFIIDSRNNTCMFNV